MIWVLILADIMIPSLKFSTFLSIFLLLNLYFDYNILYFIVLTIQGLFDIRPTDGAVSVKSRLDRETVEQISLKVFVRDENAAMAQPIQTATGTIF